MTDLTVLTAVQEGKGEDLRRYLRGPSRREQLAGLSAGTHFARFVVIELDSAPYLYFSSRFDGAAGEYLSALVRRQEVLEIWAYCSEPKPVDETSLLAYLLKQQGALPASYVVEATPPDRTVEQINAALKLQEDLSRFASEAEGLSAVDFAQRFWELESVKDILEI